MAETTNQPGIWINFEAQKLVQVCAGELRERGLSPVDLMVLLSIVRHFGPGQKQGWVAYETIAAESSCDPRTAIRAVKRLIEADILAKAGKTRGGENLYQLLLTEEHYTKGLSRMRQASSDNLSCDSESPPLCQSVTPPLTDSHPPSDSASPPLCQSVTQVQIQNRSEERPKERPRTDSLTADGLLADRFAPVNQGRQSMTPDDLDDSKPARPAKRKPLALQSTGRFATEQTQSGVTDPAVELAAWYHSLIGEPERERKAAEKDWPGILHPLIDSHGVETVKVVMTWASESAFWGDKIRRKSGDSAEYALDKFPTWLDQRADEAERATKKSAATSMYRSVEYPAASSRPAGQPKLEISKDPTWDYED